MAIEQEVIFREYVRTTAQVLAVIGAGAGESIFGVAPTDGVVVTTKKSPPLTHRMYRISYPDARSLLGLENGEVIYETVIDGEEVTIRTRQQTV